MSENKSGLITVGMRQRDGHPDRGPESQPRIQKEARKNTIKAIQMCALLETEEPDA